MQTDSKDYIEVVIDIEPFSEEMAEIAEALLSDLPYDTFLIEEPYLKAYIQKSSYDQMALKAVLSCLEAKTTFTAAPVPARNWNAEWEESIKPIEIAGKVTVRYDDEVVPRKTRFNIRLRPNMAFGTGYHQTTSMMMKFMLDHEDRIRGKVVLDMGCGTGVLGILAAKMKAEKVYAIDIDAVAAQSAFDNAWKNRVSKTVESYCGDASLLQMGKYDVILANIHRNIIIQDLPTYVRCMKKNALLFVSGFFESDIKDIVSAAESLGLCLDGQCLDGEWASLKFRK